MIKKYHERERWDICFSPRVVLPRATRVSLALPPPICSPSLVVASGRLQASLHGLPVKVAARICCSVMQRVLGAEAAASGR